ncbi:MAG: serine/threonine protein kinase [Fusobacteriaceae bacterium]
MKKIILLFFTIIFLVTFSEDKKDYTYPYKNPYVATIVGSSSLMLEEEPPKIYQKEFTIFTENSKEIPTSLWYEKGFKFSLVKQKKPAPLIFIIAGTGASHDSLRMNYFQRIFYNDGYNVISITSPVHMNFILNTSKNKMPGPLLQDSEDIYEVMKSAYSAVKNKIEPTETYLMGYSLGATQAAFVSYLDDKEKVFNFKRTYMINPVVDMYSSATLLDELLEKNINGDKGNIGELVDEVLTELSKSKNKKSSNITEESIFEIFKNKVLSNEKMGALIGLAFRMIAVDFNYVTDLVNKRNVYITEPVEKYESLFPFYKKIDFAGLIDYFEKIAKPYYKEKGISTKELLKSVKINEIENYLKKSEKIAMVTNEDELILKSEEIGYLKEIFGSRIIVYPNGGHCGNMYYTPNVKTMLNYFKNGVLVYEK